MRPTLVLAACLLAAAPGRALAGDRYALLVGVKQYDKAELTPLEFTENDVTALSVYLKASGYKRVVLMTQEAGRLEARYLPTAANVRKELKGLLEDRRPDDTVVLAFCGHGVQFRGSDEPYFCPMDAALKSRSSLISLSEVYGQLARCRAKNKVIFSDCCRNDPLPRGPRAALSKQITAPNTNGSRDRVPENVVALFSCSAGEVAWESDKHRHGVFFYFLIEGLKKQAATPGTSQVTIASLADYVQRHVGDFVKAEISASARQRPELFGRFSAPVVIATVTDEVLSQTPKTVFEARKRSLELIQAGNHRQAAAEASRGITADPKEAFLFAIRAHARERMGEGTKALLDADEATRLNPKLSHPFYTRGCVLLYLRKQPAKAVEEFTQALRRDEGAYASYLERGRAYVALNDDAKAADDFTEMIRRRPDAAGAYRERALVARRSGDVTAAKSDLDAAIGLQPGYALALADRGWIHFSHRKDHAAALADFEEALKHDGRSPSALHGRAAVKIQRKEYGPALTDLAKALEGDPKRVGALLDRGHCFFVKGDYRTAMADASAVIRLDPKNARAWNDRGACHAMLRKLDLAVKDYDRAIELAPAVSLYRTNRAHAYKALGRTKEAEADQAKAKSLGTRR